MKDHLEPLSPCCQGSMASTISTLIIYCLKCNEEYVMVKRKYMTFETLRNLE